MQNCFFGNEKIQCKLLFIFLTLDHFPLKLFKFHCRKLQTSNKNSSHLTKNSHLFEILFLIAEVLLYLLPLGVGFLELRPQPLKLILQRDHLSAGTLLTTKGLQVLL